MHIEIAVDLAIVSFQLHPCFHVSRKGYVNIAVERTERHGLVCGDLLDSGEDFSVERVENRRSRDVGGGDSPVCRTDFKISRKAVHFNTAIYRTELHRRAKRSLN